MDYYEILGLAADASTQDIKKAFRQIARECHPDVTGDDPVAAERFKEARKAYETLVDPVTRSRYDRRGQQRRNFGGASTGQGSFFDAFYRNMSEQAEKGQRRGGTTYAPNDHGGSPGAGRRSKHDPNNDLDLEDLFNGFGNPGFAGSGGPKTKEAPPSDFGFGKGPPPGYHRGGPGPRVHAEPSGGRRGPVVEDEPPPFSPTPGADVHIDLEVTPAVAERGGTLTAVYYRLQRADAWRPGSTDAGVVRVQDIADVRVVPGVRDGEVVVERGLGDAGAHGGPYGDLVVRLRIVAPPPPASRERPKASAPPPEAERAREERPREERPREERRERAAPPAEEPTGEEHVQDVPISIAEAVLGGRIEVDTPQGRVRVNIPPGTSSGAKMRLRGKGPAGKDGVVEDLYLVTRIVVPKDLDDESRRLIEEFGRRNPESPRG